MFWDQEEERDLKNEKANCMYADSVWFSRILFVSHLVLLAFICCLPFHRMLHDISMLSQLGVTEGCAQVEIKARNEKGNRVTEGMVVRSLVVGRAWVFLLLYVKSS